MKPKYLITRTPSVVDPAELARTGTILAAGTHVLAVPAIGLSRCEPVSNEGAVNPGEGLA